MKRFLSAIKGDCTRLFGYPRMRVPEDYAIDYDLYWEARGRGALPPGGETLSAWQRSRAAIAARCIERGSTVLDLGSGGGAVLEYLRDARAIRPIAVEVSRHALDSLRAKEIEALEIDITSVGGVAALPTADYIIGFEILEHLPNPEQLIHELIPHARKGMIFSFPNTGYYAHRLRLLFGRFPLQWVVHPGEHLRYWTLTDVRSWAPQLNLRVRYLTAYQGLPGLNRLWPALFGAGVILILDTGNDEEK